VDVSDPTRDYSGNGAHGSDQVVLPHQHELSRRDPLIGLRDRPLLLVLVLLAAIAAAVIVARAAPTEYASEADVLVSPVDAESETLEGLGLLQGENGSVVAAARLVESEAVAKVVRRRLGLAPGEPAPIDDIEVIPLPQSDLVAIKATTASPKRAARTANAFADSLIIQRTRAFQRRRASEIVRVEGLVNSLGEGQANRVAQLEVLRERLRTLEAFKGADDPTLSVFKRATAPDEPKTRPAARVVAAFLAVLIGGLGLVIALGGLTPRLLSELELPVVLPVLTRVPWIPFRTRLNVGGRAPGALAEPFRTLAIRLAAGRSDGRLPRTVVVTSVGTRDGKTSTAAYLALAIAARGERVLLVDGDLGRPRLERAFGLTPQPVGLATVLGGDAGPIEPLLVDLGGAWHGVRLLPAGRASGHELLDPEGVAFVTTRLLEHADVLIVDAPLITHSADALALTHRAEAVLLAVRLGVTRRDWLTRSLDVFRTARIDVTGLVVGLRRSTVRRRWLGGSRAAWVARPQTEAEGPREASHGQS
jgi:Mrp family chromosome partitioning ATPase/capsular polysaccharide biosynthesis protein